VTYCVEIEGIQPLIDPFDKEDHMQIIVGTNI